MDRRKFLKQNFATLLCLGISSKLYSSDNIYVNQDGITTFESLLQKLNQIQAFVGFGNFNIISFDEAYNISKKVSKIGKFEKNELDLMERFFYEDSAKYGFYGLKTCQNLTDTISKKDIIKIPNTGHYLFRGKPLEIYQKMVKDVGDTLFLTSGVRSVLKQLNLYMAKIKNCDYDITKASFSLAPPARSYHSIGDFDVGKRGYGALNFTEEFTKTDEFKKLVKLDYVDIRYTKNNLDGVRFEPWHIKII